MKRAKRVIYVILLLVFIAIFLVSGYLLLDYFLESQEQTGKYDDLLEMVEAAKEEANSATTPDKSGLGGENMDDGSIDTVKLVTVTDPETGEEVTVLAEYAELYRLNKDLEGWIQIPDTTINYPIMHAPDAQDYYLYLNFYEEYSNHGSIYIREQCDLNEPTDNVTIYGHNMKDGSMFAPLLNYESKDFWDAHKTIMVDTLTEHHLYQIIAVFTTTASVGKGFEYHTFVDAATEEEFDEYISTCKSLALYDTGLTAEYGDTLITLSTCEYSQTNGRLVVVAKRITG